MAKTWRSYIFHPLFISLIISVLSIFFIVRYIPYYKTSIVESFTVTNNGQIYFSDIDFDGNSEKLQYYHYDQIFEPTLYLYDSENKIQSLWNFFELPINNYRIYTGDFNNDHFKEIFVFTQKNDSVFFYALNIVDDKKPYARRKFVTTFSGKPEKLQVKVLGVYNLDHLGDSELLFFIDNQYPKIPTRLFAYNFNKDEFISSPNLDVDIRNQILIQDIDGDDYLDIIVSNNSVEIQGNGNQSQFIVLDHKLNYKYNPVKYHGIPSQISTTVIKGNDSIYIACLRSGTAQNEVFNNLLLFNQSGTKVNEKQLSYKTNATIISNQSTENIVILSGRYLFFLDSNLEHVKRKKIRSNNKLKYIGSLESNFSSFANYIFRDSTSLILLSDDLKRQVEIGNFGKSDFIMSVSESKNGQNYLSVQSRNKWFLVEVTRNDFILQSGLFQIITFVLIFLVIFSIVHLIRRRPDQNQLDSNVVQKTETDDEFKNDSVQEKDADNQQIVKELKKNEKLTDKNVSNDSKNEFIKLLNNYSSVKYKFYPENEKFIIPHKMKITLMNFLNSSLTYLSDDKCAGGSIFIQFFRHKGQLNICTEINNKCFNKEKIKKKIDFDTLIDKFSWTFDIAEISDDSNIINTTVPLKDLEKSNQIKVIIAEDHDVSLFGLLSLFKPYDDIEIVGTAKNGMEVLSLLESNEADVVITDISMPGMDGIELSERLKNEYPAIKVIVFTMYMENWFVEQLIKNDVKGFVSKSSKVNELIGAVHNVFDGVNYYCPQFKSKFGIKANQNGDNKSKLESLSSGEMQILKYYADNYSKNNIAEKLHISIQTMDSIIANILLKINAADEDEIKQIAKRQKFISE